MVADDELSGRSGPAKGRVRPAPTSALEVNRWTAGTETMHPLGAWGSFPSQFTLMLPPPESTLTPKADGGGVLAVHSNFARISTCSELLPSLAEACVRTVTSSSLRPSS